MSMLVRPSVPASLALALGALLTLAGCEEEKKPSTSLIDAGADAGLSSIDPKLAAAVAAAAAAPTGSAKASAGPGAGPPESGIFAPGAADATHAKGAPPKIEVLDEGREPRSALKIDLASDAEQRSTVMVGVRLGAQGAMPNIDFALGIKADKPKADKTKAADAKEPAAPAGSRLMLARVIEATPSAKQPGAMPKEIADQVKKLKGSQIRFTLAGNGAATGYAVQLAKDADPNLDAPLQAAVEALSIMTVPLPDKPVGVGGYWLTTDRADSFGIDVVRYRVFRVEKIDQGNVTLSVECRHWATDNKISLALGADKTDLSVQQFESLGKGSVVHGATPFIPGAGDITQSTRAVALIARGNQPPQPVPIQTELTGKLSTDAKPAAAKSP